MKILFMGTPNFAKGHLKALVDEGYEVVAALCQPDKPRGRKKILTMPPVKEYAISRNIPVYQPETLKNGEAESILNEFKPDIIVVVAYGKLLPKYVLDYPKYGCINVHGSLLPEYRGAAPVQRAIIDGKKKTGITVMYMDEGLDTGDMLLKEECDIAPNDDGQALFDKLEIIGGRALIKALKQIESGNATRERQNDEGSSYAEKLTSETGLIEWNKDAEAVHNLVRGTYPWPSAYSYLNGEKIKITKTSVVDLGGAPGEVICPTKKGELIIACKSGAVKVLRLQAQGGKEMDAADYMRGHEILPGTFFA